MKHLDRENLHDAWVLFFCLGIVMLNYPFLEIFNKTVTVMGVPLLVAYFFIGWPLSIFIIFLFARSLNKDDDENR